ncbi:uncharacterized protein N7484_000778 [Penicillium longicatenatum]|uniref:uncharacterized protein n=1 Tax=Penicillium longicatenatum TaxID=1561947 RepID=UPI0025494002|nr:uncharacterized protein N7484_000778 [Penicillium longicatenatum]KAJ5657129.1 hypothetical protein N7484_000778 [Penicillium longicatenatum]
MQPLRFKWGLDADSILLTECENVGIAVEASCEISKSEIDWATLKRLAMAEIVARLLKKNPSSYQKSAAAAESLPGQLKGQSVEELLQVSELSLVARRV